MATTAAIPPASRRRSVLVRLVDAEQTRTGRTCVRLPGSRILRGTRLGHWTCPTV